MQKCKSVFLIVILDKEGEMLFTVRIDVETTVGRAILSAVLPEGMPFELINCVMKKKAISGVINEGYRRVGLKDTVVLADQLMYTGYKYATLGGCFILCR